MRTPRCLCGKGDPDKSHLANCYFCTTCNRWATNKTRHDEYCLNSVRGTRENPEKLFCPYCHDTFSVSAYPKHLRRKHPEQPFVKGEYWRAEFDDPDYVHEWVSAGQSQALEEASRSAAAGPQAEASSPTSTPSGTPASAALSQPKAGSSGVKKEKKLSLSLKKVILF